MKSNGFANHAGVYDAKIFLADSQHLFKFIIIHHNERQVCMNLLFWEKKLHYFTMMFTVTEVTQVWQTFQHASLPTKMKKIICFYDCLSSC